jgi:heat-inducible transcriptional repressor
MSGGLDERKEAILRAIVVEYVSAAEPVASEMLVQKYDLGVKSATVRNEMAEMSEMGYLEQPHTSAGRIPSDQGYRYFVDRLIVQRNPSPALRQKVKDAAEVGDALQTLLRDTTRALSRLTHLLSAATIVRDGTLTVRTAMLSAIGAQQALLVVVLSNGHVENRMIELPQGLTLAELGQANELLASATVGQTLRSFARAKTPAGSGQANVDRLLGILWNNVRSIAKELTRGGLITEGEEFMFGQPEFQRDLVYLSELLSSLSDSGALYEAVQAPADTTQTVTIGREHRREEMHQLSVVRQSFFVGESEAGTIALIGPTRMHYDASIPLVNYTARALSDSLTKFFG